MLVKLWLSDLVKGMGVRYNAEKTKIGNYFTTFIFLFRFKCHLCPNYIEIKTDPEKAEYVIVSGARKRVESFSAKDAETIEFQSLEEKEKLQNDAFYKLEHGIQDEKKLKDSVPILNQIQQLNESQWKDPYTMSQKLRSKFRQEKKIRKEDNDESEALQKKHGLGLKLLPKSKTDDMEAEMAFFKDQEGESLEMRKRRVLNSSIFQSQKPLASSSVIPKIANHASKKRPLEEDPVLQETQKTSLSLLTAYNSGSDDTD